MTPGPQSIRIAVDAVWTSVPDAGVSGCGAEVPDPTIVTRVMAFLPDVASADRRTTKAPPSGLRRRSACRDYDTSGDETASVPIFSGLDAAGLESVGRTVRTRRFRRGEVIFHLGDPGDALFIVMSGAIKISLPSDAGDEAILATLRSSDVFGELALLDGAPRSATATALEPTETLVLPREQFRELIATEPAVRDALLASIASELRRLTNHVEELHFLDITGRLASRLARLATDGGKRLPDGSIRLAAPLTQGDLAAMIGCTRQSVNKLLGIFTDDGLIRLDRDSIVVLDLEGLGRAARR
jgi:CRP-like cAMP-binding protein